MKIIILAVVLCQFTVVFGQKGIDFDTSFTSWEEVLLEAKQMNKPIFVDLYTTWCGPCKYMDKNIFPQSNVGKYYNENFLCIRLDAEKGYGISFNKKNEIGAYPSFLFFTPAGETLQINQGAREAQPFIELGQSIMIDYKSGNTLQVAEGKAQEMDNKIKNGKNDPAFLIAYIKKLGLVKKTDIPVFEKYLSGLSADSLYSGTTTTFVSRYYNGWMSSNSLGFLVLLHAYKEYPIRDMELMKPWWAINGRLTNNIDLAITQRDSIGMEDVINGYRKFDTESDHFQMDKEYVYSNYFAGIGDSLNFIKHLRQYIKDNVVNQEEGKQQHQEMKRYKAALKFKFGIDNEKLLATKDKWFLKSYICNYKLILMQLKSLEYQNTYHLKKNQKYQVILLEALEIALKNYAKFSPNYNKAIVPFFLEKKL